MFRFLKKACPHKKYELVEFDGENVRELTVKQEETNIRLGEEIFAEKLVGEYWSPMGKSEYVAALCEVNEIQMKNKGSMIGWIKDTYRKMPIVRFYKM